MKIAIMQPYLFPYVGYFQLINAADKFVVYDDVTFIKQGWINRNKILLNGAAFLFTIPLKDASSYKLIRETKVSDNFNWKSKLIKTLEQAYGKAPYYAEAIKPIKEVIFSEEKSIAAIALKSLKVICSYAGIDTPMVETSSNYLNDDLQSQARVIDICKRENATEYLNPVGGLELYSHDAFNRENIKLSFVKPRTISYLQFNNQFVPWLSTIDVMMFNSPAEIKEMMNQYEIV
jgi:hypothetical protein